MFPEIYSCRCLPQTLCVEVMHKKIKSFLTLLVCILVGSLIGRIIQPGIIVWEHVQDIQAGEYVELEILSTKGWSINERWRIYTLDMTIDPSSSNRPVIALGHEGDLKLSLFKGLRHNDKFDVFEADYEDNDRLLYRIPIDALSNRPVRLWLWSGDTGYKFSINGIELKERVSWRLTKDNPYFYYVL